MNVSPSIMLAAEAARTDWSESALLWTVNIGIFVIIASMVLCLVRIVRGPTLPDRGIASDTFAVQVVALVVLLTIKSQSLAFFDGVLIVSILGFVSTVAFAQFIARRGAVA
ncbi:MAG: monovalent cation/H+ antiporter complex subunit F [Planctomycetota bacterium]